MWDLGLIPGLGKSPGEGKGYPLQYSDWEFLQSTGSQRVRHDWVSFISLFLLFLLPFSAAQSFLKTSFLFHSLIYSCFLPNFNSLFVVKWWNSFRGKARWMWFLPCVVSVIQVSWLLQFMPAFRHSAVPYCLQRALCVCMCVWFSGVFCYLVESLELLLAKGSVW